MTPNFERVVILADESANWKIAGLRQLERLVLALDELAKLISSQCKIDIFVFWRPDIALQDQWRPQNPRLTRIQFVQVMRVGVPEWVLNTRMLVKRRGLEELVHHPVPLGSDPALGEESEVWQKLWQRIQNGCTTPGDLPQSDTCRYLASAREIPQAERWLLRGSAKSHDGFVSRYLNRPISRAVSRFLLRTAVTPNAWTWGITLCPVIAFLFLVRGDYLGLVTGAAILQLHSVLDGCDGEIARAKYLDSEKGPGLDALGDLISLLLFALGLGVGLFRAASGYLLPRWIFLLEGLFTFLFIAMRLGPHTVDLLRRGPAAVVSSRHDESLRASGGRLFGRRFTSLAFEFTKRDVVFLAFLILAALGLAQWILHLLFVYALATFVLRHSSAKDGRPISV
jgi:phosphatidylglycerophosphate synthase